MDEAEFLVIGAGIAGASVAAHLAEHGRVAILEMEDRPGYHTTGRSAAAYEPNYGPAPMLAFTRASHSFFMAPPPGFADGPLFAPRPSLTFEGEGQEAQSAALLAKAKGVEEITPAAAKELYPVLRDGYARRVFLDRGTGGLDVDLLHRGYLRLFKARGGRLLTTAGVSALTRRAGRWIAATAAGEFSGAVLINAAGAWGDVVARMAGAEPLGLVPRRRSIGVIAAPPEFEGKIIPFATDVGETWYANPQSGKLLVSSADATPVEPHDAYADDMAIAEGVERLQAATTIEVNRLEHSWGGLRTFAPDGSPAVGFDPHTEGFFWLAGQGGYGIQSSPALSRAAAALARRMPVPADVIDAGLTLRDITPERFAKASVTAG